MYSMTSAKPKGGPTTKLVHARDVRARELLQRACLAAETLDALVGDRGLRVEHLDGDLLVEGAFTAREPHDAECPDAEGAFRRRTSRGELRGRSARRAELIAKRVFFT
jgi:hypothetical protein